MEVILPEGFVIHRITRSIPALTKKDPVPPFSFVNLRDGSHLSIAARNLGPGGTCMLEYAFARKKTSYAFLSVCIALMVLCLVCFRDILKEGKDARSHG
jgi:hypothetical protein